MAFLLNVGTDLLGSKYATQLEFGAMPTMSELILAVESRFDKEAAAALNGVPFRLQTMQVFDDVLQRWTDLYSTSQLRSGAQLHVFQPTSLLHTELPGRVPVAPVVDYLGSPGRARIAADLGINGALSEKLRRIYTEFDVDGKVAVPSLRDYFLAHNVAWNEATLGGLYSRTADITFEDWAKWGMTRPAVIDGLYYARFGVKMDQPLFTVPEHVPPTGAERDNIAARRAREEELRRSYSLGWTAEREQIDRQYRAQRAADLDLQIRHLTTKNKLDRIRASERADADAISLSRAMVANAASPPRVRSDLCRMYYSPASPRFGYLSP